MESSDILTESRAKGFLASAQDRLLRHSPVLVGLLFVYSGSYKLLLPGEATLALAALEAPLWICKLTVAAITTVELYLGAILLAKLDLKHALLSTTVLMLIFSLFLFYLSTLAHPPSCGCMGLTGVFKSSRHNALVGLFRNVLLLWLLKATYDYYFGYHAASGGINSVHKETTS
jgi:hypothetical protein